MWVCVCERERRKVPQPLENMNYFKNSPVWIFSLPSLPHFIIFKIRKSVREENFQQNKNNELRITKKERERIGKWKILEPLNEIYYPSKILFAGIVKGMRKLRDINNMENISQFVKVFLFFWERAKNFIKFYWSFLSDPRCCSQIGN